MDDVMSNDQQIVQRSNATELFSFILVLIGFVIGC